MSHRLDVHHYIHWEPNPNDEVIIAKLDELLALAKVTQHEQERIMADLTSLQDAVHKNDDAVDSAVTLLQGLSAQIAALKTDPAALQALADEINTKAQALADAVVANTPAAP